MPWTSSSPSSSVTAAVKSSAPADEPAFTTTMSAASSAVSTAARIPASESAWMAYGVASAPHSVAVAASMVELKSMMAPGAGVVPTGTSSLPVGMIATRGTAPHLDVVVAGGRDRAQIHRAQALPGGRHQLGGHDVLAHRPHVLPRGDRRENLDRAVPAVVDVLDHHHRVHLGAASGRRCPPTSRPARFAAAWARFPMRRPWPPRAPPRRPLPPRGSEGWRCAPTRAPRSRVPAIRPAAVAPSPPDRARRLPAAPRRTAAVPRRAGCR